MTVADATAAYESARAAFERAAADLRAALDLEVSRLTDDLPPELRAVADAVAAEWQVERADLLGRSRRREHVEPRFALLVIAGEACPHYSREHLAAHFHRDHGMIAHAAKAVRRLCDCDPNYRARVARIRAALAGATA